MNKIGEEEFKKNRKKMKMIYTREEEFKKKEQKKRCI